MPENALIQIYFYLLVFKLSSYQQALIFFIQRENFKTRSILISTF